DLGWSVDEPWPTIQALIYGPSGYGHVAHVGPKPRKRPLPTKHPRFMVIREMELIPRRSLLSGSMTAVLGLGMPPLMLGAGPRPVGPNDAVNVAAIGLGSTAAVGGVGGRGHQLIGRLRESKRSRANGLW